MKFSIVKVEVLETLNLEFGLYRPTKGLGTGVVSGIIFCINYLLCNKSRDYQYIFMKFHTFRDIF